MPMNFGMNLLMIKARNRKSNGWKLNVPIIRKSDLLIYHFPEKVWMRIKCMLSIKNTEIKSGEETQLLKLTMVIRFSGEERAFESSSISTQNILTITWDRRMH